MRVLSNMHTHTVFCDGQNTVDEMVNAAIERGFVSLGFSIHGWTPYELLPLSFEKEAAYRKAVREAAQRYVGQIEILCGAERDALYARDFSDYDYLIDSTHVIQRDGAYLYIDSTEQMFLDNVRQYFGGDFYAYCRAYFEREAEVCARSDAAFIGHIDLVCKFNEGNRWFDENDPRYLKPALEAAEAAVRRGIPIEMNTGAIGRGWRASPYPRPEILRQIRAWNGEILINSDAHSADKLDIGFDLCEELARACGFDHVLRMRRAGLEEVSI